MGSCMSTTQAQPVRAKTQQGRQNTATKTSTTTTTKRVKPQTNTPTISKPKKALVNKSNGHTLGEATNEKTEDPREAARKAAEERYQAQQSKDNKGELSKKLQQERAKSGRAHLKEAADNKLNEKNAIDLTYD